MSAPVIIFSGTLFATNHVQLLLLTVKILHAQIELRFFCYGLAEIASKATVEVCLFICMHFLPVTNCQLYA